MKKIILYIFCSFQPYFAFSTTADDWAYNREVGNFSHSSYACSYTEYHYVGSLDPSFDTLEFDIESGTDGFYFSPWGTVLNEYGYTDNFSEPILFFSNPTQGEGFPESVAYVTNSNILESYSYDKETGFYGWSMDRIVGSEMSINHSNQTDLISVKIQRTDDCYTVSFFKNGIVEDSVTIYTDADFNPYILGNAKQIVEGKTYNIQDPFGPEVLKNFKLYNSQIPEPLHIGIIFAFVSITFLCFKRK